ncbi:unnamed protein product, partial [Ixodes pacificus]
RYVTAAYHARKRHRRHRRSSSRREVWLVVSKLRKLARAVQESPEGTNVSASSDVLGGQRTSQQERMHGGCSIHFLPSIPALAADAPSKLTRCRSVV